MLNQEQIGAIWIALAVGLLALLQWWLGQEMTATIVATALGIAAAIRDAYAILSEAPDLGARSAGQSRSKARRYLLGG